MNTRTVHDPFVGKDVQISNRLVDRLRGKYANGPTMPNGEPEFGWQQMPEIPIQCAAADRIEELERALRLVEDALTDEIDLQDNGGVQRACRLIENVMAT